MIIQTVTIVSLAILLLESAFIIVNCFLKKRPERIVFLRSFKKGKCAVIFASALPLYLIGYVYGGQDILNAFFRTVSRIIGLVVLSYDTDGIDALMADNPLYGFTIYFMFVLVIINALLFTASLAGQRIWSAARAHRVMTARKEKLFIFGCNDSNTEIYESDKSRIKAIVGNISDKDSEQLYLKKITYIQSPAYVDFIKRIFSRLLRIKKRHILVINTGSDEKNISICRSIIKAISEKDDAGIFGLLRVFVFGDPEYEAIYTDIVSDGYGCIEYVNKYKKIAIDFIDRYPFSKFLDGTRVDYETSLLRRDVDINVLMIGFGMTNRQIFLTSVANNQFLTEGENGPCLKPVRYYMFDKKATENNKNLNHSYYRYKNEFSNANPDEYLPLPALPAEEKYLHLDVNDGDYYNSIRSIVTSNPMDMNFIIVGFGTDLENIDMAQKLIEKRDEWSLENLIIFVKVRVKHEQQALAENKGCFFIGDEKETVYDINGIVNDRLLHMAQMRNETYDLENNAAHNPGIIMDGAYLKAHHERSLHKWYTVKSQMERESSVYCCLSLRSKLNLMGLDYCGIGDNDREGLTEQEYLNIYAKDDMPERNGDVAATDKPVIKYTLDFKRSRRGNMAIHEHQRWNSFMISKGMVPSGIDMIINELNAEGKHTDGKNYSVRRHGNLTTFDGLVQFRKLLAARDSKDEKELDVIKYDYQLLDDAYWFITGCGCKIIKK